MGVSAWDSQAKSDSVDTILGTHRGYMNLESERLEAHSGESVL